MTDSMQDAAVLWTGGKDSALALYEAGRNGCRVRCLATFAPPQPDFKAHPLTVIRLQAQALGLPHHVLPVTAPFAAGYETALRKLRDEFGVGCAITGDIDEIDGKPNWIGERCRAVGMRVHLPLWGRERELLLEQLLERGFRTRISCVDMRRLDASWVGRELDGSSIAELRAVHARTGIDLCGEEGEYHTLIVDGPSFARLVEIRSRATRTVGPLAYMVIQDAVLADHGM